jgi:hypothetical protein
MSEKFVRIGDLAVGTAVTYEFGSVSVKGYVGESSVTPRGDARVTLMRTKTTGRRHGNLPADRLVALR